MASFQLSRPTHSAMGAHSWPLVFPWQTAISQSSTAALFTSFSPEPQLSLEQCGSRTDVSPDCSSEPYTLHTLPEMFPTVFFFFLSDTFIIHLSSCVTESNNWLPVPPGANDISDWPCCTESNTVATDDINLLPLISWSLSGSSTVAKFPRQCIFLFQERCSLKDINVSFYFYAVMWSSLNVVIITTFNIKMLWEEFFFFWLCCVILLLSHSTCRWNGLFLMSLDLLD